MYIIAIDAQLQHVIIWFPKKHKINMAENDYM